MSWLIRKVRCERGRTHEDEVIWEVTHLPTHMRIHLPLPFWASCMRCELKGVVAIPCASLPRSCSPRS